MRRILLLRHGRTRANDEWLYCGSTDLPLSEKGREELAAMRKDRRWPDIAGFHVYTSGMRRTEETLSAIYGDVPHKVAAELREMDFGIFEMRSYEQLKDDPVYREWCSGDNERNIAPGGESGEQMTRRVIEAFKGLLARDEDFAVVTHGGPIAALMAYVFPNEDRNRFQWQPKNGCGYMLELEGDQKSWTVVPEEGEDYGEQS